jgi:hypothetical protein
VYRGLYEWDDPERAADYADQLVHLLIPRFLSAIRKGRIDLPGQPGQLGSAGLLPARS